MTGFLEVLLRGLGLCGQALGIGGVLFAAGVLRRSAVSQPALVPALRRSLALAALGAAVAGFAQLLAVALQLGSLLGGAMLVFPLVCVAGGGLLLAHSHSSLDLKEEFLTEITHVPLGLLGMLAGWARWLELRLPPADARVPRWLWALALVAVGVLLVLYREH